MILCILALLTPCAVGRALPPQLPEPGAAHNNEVYLPTAAAALEQLTLGDREMLQALQAGPASRGHWTRAFEAWRSALTASDPGDAVPVGIQLAQQDRGRPEFAAAIKARWPDRDNSFGRRTEAVEWAVLRRLCGLDLDQRRAWRDHFTALAEKHARPFFATGLSPAPNVRSGLRRIEREFPGTDSAFSAGLWLFEDALESGQPRSAQAWLGRALLHAKILAQPRFEAAVAKRQQVLDPLLGEQTGDPSPWTHAQEFEPMAGHTLTLPNRSKPRSMARIEGQPGLAFVDGHMFLVQTTGTCWLLSDEHEDRIFEPWRLGFELQQPIPRTVKRTGRDWPFFPLAAQGDLYIVSGRADGNTSNLIQRIRPPHDAELPRAMWSLGGNGLVRPGSPALPLASFLEAGMWEFQPGPIFVEGTLYVQARRWVTTESGGVSRANAPGEAEAWVLALDARSGVPRWSRKLCRGTDIAATTGLRLGGAPLIRTPAQPLRATRSQLFVGTNLGAGFLLDLADGRLLTSFANDRREASERGWRSALRPNSWEQRAQSEPLVLWAPNDGLDLYALRAGLDFAPVDSATGAGEAPRHLVPFPPLERQESSTLLGGSAQEVLVFGKAGARLTVSAHNLATGARRDSIYLAREEHPVPSALLAPGKLLFATDRGLYRLDRQRELYLEFFQPLHMGSEFAPGGLYVRGQHVFLLVDGALFRFRAL